MESWSALYFTILFFACITRLHAPHGIEESSTPAHEMKPESSESPKPVTKTENPKLSTSPDDSSTQSQEISSSMSSATLELEEFVTPTVAPATPSYDIESSSPIVNSASSIESYAKASGYVLASVILIPPSDPGQIQSSQGSQGAKVNKESVNTESAVPTKGPEVLSSFLDSTPPNPISSEPMPTPPTTTTAKEEEDSITAALKQAEEENKPKEEEMPSFDEFKRRVLQEEEEKSKQLNNDHASGTAQKPKKVKERKQSNYASVDCGAKILDHNNEASNADSVLVENKDLYMLNPCSAQVWFVVELCDLAQVKSIQIANFELFSSTPESFRVSVSTRYPTREWTMLGTFQAREERKVQTFPLDEPIYAKYFKVEMLSHFGSEHYCPLSLLRVYGSSMMEELEDHETDGQEDNDNTDSDSDVPVLPPEPGAKMEDEAKKQNLLERAADTVISLVKKITGNGHDKEKGDYSQGDYIQGDVDSELDTLKLSNGVVTYDMKSEDENKGKLVTLVGHEELKESPEDQSSASDVRNTSQGNSAPVNKSDEGSSWFEEANSQKESATTSVALSSCQLFSQLIGQYSLGCFMGRLLFSKSKHFTLSLDLSKRQNTNLPNKTSCSVDAKEKNDSIENKEGDDQENISGQEEPILEKPSVTESSEEGNTPSQAENQKFSTFTPEPPSINVELKSENSVSQNLQFVETISTSSRSVKPSHSIDSLQNSEVSDDKTPALEEVSVVTSVPLNSTQSASPSLAPQSSEVQESKESSVETVKEDLKVDNQQDVVQTPLPKSQSAVLDNQPVVSESKDMTPQPENALKPPDIPSESEGQGEKNASDKDKQADKEEQKSEYVPSECVSPNSIHMMSQSSPDIDVLETKLTDKDGREGTAQLPEETHVNLEKDQLPSVNGAPTSEVVINSASVKVEVADPFNEEAVSSGVQDQERNNDSTESSSTTVDSQSIDPTVEPTSSPTVDTPDLSDSIAPLPAPPVTGEASLSSLEVVTASSESNLDAGMLSKAQQAATSSAGMASVTGSGLHKESIFVRLSNKIKALEQNLNMSTLYMEQLNQRYRKSLDELQKNSDKKVALLTNATKKAEAVINSQKEQITKLQSKLDNLTDVIADMKARMDPLNKEVMERHIIGLCIEVVLILVLFLVFARRRNNQEIPDSPRRVGAFMNGHGPPRLAIEDGRHYNDDMMDPTVSLSGREQLLRSFGKTSDPETIGSSAATESLDNKLCKADTCNSSESKRRRNRKRKASSTTDLPPDSLGICASNKPELTPVSQSSTDTPSPASLVSRTAGLLFFGARGFFGGFQNPWKQKKPSAVHSDPNIAGRSESNLVMKASFRSNNQGITRAKSLDSVPEEAVFREHVPPPPPPPLPSEFGLMFKRPPDCYYSKKGNVKNVTSGAMKYGKYGVLDTQLA